MGFSESTCECMLYNPCTLVAVCTDTIIKKLLTGRVPRGQAGDLETNCNWEICAQVCKFYLKCLPVLLIERILDRAHKLLDNHHDVDKLLLVMLSTLEISRTRVLKTPVYLYTSACNRKRLLEKLLSSDVRLESFKEAHFDMYNFYHRPDMTHTWTEEGEVEFEMLRLSLVEEESSLLTELLERCSNLVFLSLHTVCSDQLIKTICKNCVSLQELDISFSNNVTDDGMATLATRLPLQTSLTTLKIEKTEVTQAGIFMLLEHLRSLVYIESSMMENYIYCMQNFFAKSSLLDAALVRNTGSHFGIRKLCVNLNLWREESLSIFYVITMLFPLLEQVKVHSLHRNEFVHLDCLAHLKHLKSLMLGSTPLKCLIPTFQKIGENLTTFCYVSYDQHGSNINFSIISELCPRLEFLSISGNALVHDLISDWALRSLRSVLLNVHAYIPEGIWKHLFTNCPSLENMELTKCENLNDQALASILTGQPRGLANLKKFTVKGSHRQDVLLTSLSVDLIRESCPGLQEIGDCYTWTLNRRSYSVNQIRSLL